METFHKVAICMLLGTLTFGACIPEDSVDNAFLIIKGGTL